MKRIFLVSFAALLVLPSIYLSLAADDRAWQYFPSADPNMSVALTASGDEVHMSYTPSTYELSGQGSQMKLSFYDLSVKAQAGSEDIDPLSSGARVRMLISSPSGETDWRVSCRDVSTDEERILSDGESFDEVPEELNCLQVETLSWSRSLFIDLPKSGSPLHLQIIWDDSNSATSYSDTAYRDIVNVFRIRTQGGSIGLAGTRLEEIHGFQTQEDLSSVENHLNWVILYNSDSSAQAQFLLDARNSDELYLFDKDADASRLHPESLPPDPGITMEVKWKDGGSITSDPEWTIFDQTTRPGFRPDDHQEDWTNRYEGPSGQDDPQWYRIPSDEHLKDQIQVTWKDFSLRNNGFAFAASQLLKTPELPEEELPEGMLCSDDGQLRVCLLSDPLPDPFHESFLDPGDEIEYQVLIENIDDDLPLEDVVLTIDPPEGTDLINDQDQITEDLGGLDPGERVETDFTVIISDEDPDNRDITTEDSISVGSRGRDPFQPDPLVHHVGDGLLSVTRCYQEGEWSGEFVCDISCEPFEEGSEIIVRDLLTNHSAESLTDYQYFPAPIAETFTYVPDSFRVDHYLYGIGLGNDEVFPNEGVTISGPLPPGESREVFFRFRIPEELLEEGQESQCFPDADDIEAYLESLQQSTRFEEEADCPREPVELSGVICVKESEPAQLEINFTSQPLPDSEVTPGSIISYILTLSNTTDEPIESLEIDFQLPDSTQCHELSDCGLQMISDPEAFREGYGSLELVFLVVVDEETEAERIFHPGVIINDKRSESISHLVSRKSAPEQDFYHRITLNRHIVLNASSEESSRQDKADQATLTHDFGFIGMKEIDETRDAAYPFLLGGGKAASWSFTYANHCSDYSRYYYGDQPVQRYDAPFNAQLLVYRQTPSEESVVDSFTQIPQEDVSFVITTDLPQDRPRFENLSGRGSIEQDRLIYTLSADRTLDSEMNAVNHFFIRGGETQDHYLWQEDLRLVSGYLSDTLMKASRDGQVNGANIITTNEVMAVEELWMYLRFDRQGPAITCLYRCGKSICSDFIMAPQYRWVKIGIQDIVLKDQDQERIQALSSVAWLQTKYGHLGFGEQVWSQEPAIGDPNSVALEDELVSSWMKWYLPPDQHHSDFLVTLPQRKSLISSRLGSDAELVVSTHEEFQRGEAYDRKEWARNYHDDLLKYELYGEVTRINQLNDLPDGILKVKEGYEIRGQLDLEDQSILFIDGSLSIGKQDSVTVFTGGRSRIIVSGNVQIKGNISLGSQESTVRIHSLSDIIVAPEVTDIELLILAEGTFRSGRSDQTLRILGDVIANNTAWERTPLLAERDEHDRLNEPSEIVIEDLRKHLQTAPGDQKLADRGHIWTEVLPANGSSFLQEKGPSAP